jgi:hypothetical protein
LAPWLSNSRRVTTHRSLSPLSAGIAEFHDLALLGLRGHVRIGHLPFPVTDDAVQAGIARHADDISGRVSFAPAEQALPVESGVAAGEDPDLGPVLAQPGNQELDHGGGVPGWR